MRFLIGSENDLRLIRKALTELAGARMASSLPDMKASGREADELGGKLQLATGVVPKEALKKTLEALIEANKLSVLYEGHEGMFAGHIKDAQAALDAAQT